MQICLNVHPFEVTAAQVKKLEAAGKDVDVLVVPKGKIDEIDSAEVDALVASHAPDNLDRWSKLRWLQLVSAGHDHLGGHPVWDRPIAVTTATGVHAPAMAEYVTCALLMMTHQMRLAHIFGQNRNWHVRDSWYFKTALLRGRTAGILGYGAIGRECARQLAALGMEIVCLNRSPRGPLKNRFLFDSKTGDPEGELPRQWFGLDQVDQMLAVCDALVVTLPRTPDTEDIIAGEQLAKMKPTARMIIISRGGIVNEQALATALRDKRIAGAAVDTFADEPLAADSSLFETPNTILTPHISGGFTDYWPVLCQLIQDNLARLIRGNTLLNQVN